MAIAIKSIPTLTETAAEDFSAKLAEGKDRKSSIDFSKEVSIASKILAKAKL